MMYWIQNLYKFWWIRSIFWVIEFLLTCMCIFTLLVYYDKYSRNLSKYKFILSQFILLFIKTSFFFYLYANEMASAGRRRKNNPDIFCYICGEYRLVLQRNAATSFIKRAFIAYFSMPLGDQHKASAPHIICKTCTEYQHQWNKGKNRSLKFGIPMV